MTTDHSPDQLAVKMDGHILLIDDGQAVRDGVGKIFRRRGVRICMALSKRSATKRILKKLLQIPAGGVIHI